MASFLSKLREKKTSAQLFSCEFCEILMTDFQECQILKTYFGIWIIFFSISAFPCVKQIEEKITKKKLLQVIKRKRKYHPTCTSG